MPSGVYSIPGRKAWTPDDDLTLEELASQGLTMAQIARRMGRSVNSVDVRSGRLGLMRKVRPMSARTVADLLGVACSKTVLRWIKDGHLRGRRLALRAGANHRYAVTEEALFAFLADPAHWHRWDAERITERDLREWATEHRAGVRFLTLGEVAARYCVVTATVSSWIEREELRAVRNGNHLVRESDLEGFTPPHARDHSGMRAYRFSAHEDETLLRLRGAGVSWPKIAAQMGRHMGSVSGRYKRLTRTAA